MLLIELLKDVEVEKIVGDDQVYIQEIHYDSRQVTPGSLFVCITGFKTDGHLYIQEALQKGAKGMIVEKDVQIKGATIVKVKNSRKALAAVAQVFYQNPSESMELIGVTGTNGKTSTTYMIKKILEKSGRKVGAIGTIANWINDCKIQAVRTTPESLDLQKLFRKMVDSNLDSCVMEVSSHSLELERVEYCHFKIGIFTNLTPDHLDFHKTLDSYRNSKKKLFYKTTLCNIINIDDIHGKAIADEIKSLKTPLLTFGINQNADIIAKNIILSSKEVVFDVVTPTFQETVQVSIPGMFTVYNALGSIAAAYSLGISKEVIVGGLKDIQGVPGRFELVTEIHKFSVIIDYAHTPDALENVLKFAKSLAKNRLITVFGCGGDRDQTKRPIMGEISGKYSDLTVITSDNPRTEDPRQILSMIEEGIRNTLGKYTVIEDRREAIRYALQNADRDDVILIAGKGHETTQIIKDKVIAFDDRQVAIEVAREEGMI